MRLTLFLLFMYSSNAFSQTIVNGQVIDRTLCTPVYSAFVYVWLQDYENADTIRFVTWEGKDTMRIEPALIMVDSMMTDSTGKYSFTAIEGARYRVWTYHIFDSTYSTSTGEPNWSLNDQRGQDLILYLQVYCEYAPFQNQDWCPVCSKKNKCIPVSYGLPTPTSEKEILDSFNPRKWKVFNAGCMRDRSCEARWYCKRCEKLF